MDDVERDRDALERCVELARREPGRDWQIREMLKDTTWEEVARFAAYGMQGQALHLKPWQEPPCCADEDAADERDKDAQQLLRRMLAAGLSRYEPDPLGALARVEAAAKQ